MPSVYTLEGYKGGSQGAAYYVMYPDRVAGFEPATGRMLYANQHQLGCVGCNLKGPADGSGGRTATLVVAGLMTVAGVGLAALAAHEGKRKRRR